VRGIDPATWLAIAASIGSTSLGQVLLKTGMMQPVVQAALSERSGLLLAQAFFGEVRLIAGLFLYGAAALAWMFVLARIDLSLAYPFIGLSFILVLLLCWIALGERPDPTGLAGTLLIAIGVGLIAGRSAA
jgi:drug/metabolite transporter (DMT)-like permease